MTFLKQIKITCFIEFVSLYSCPDIYNKINKFLVRFFDLNINLQDNLKNISACLPILKTQYVGVHQTDIILMLAQDDPNVIVVTLCATEIEWTCSKYCIQLCRVASNILGPLQSLLSNNSQFMLANKLYFSVHIIYLSSLRLLCICFFGNINIFIVNNSPY